MLPSIANSLWIPNIQSVWDYSTSKKVFHNEFRNNFSLNLYPDASLLSQAFKDWTEASELKALTIIYERKEGEQELFSSLIRSGWIWSSVTAFY